METLKYINNDVPEEEDCDNYKDVMEGLQPHAYLRELSIINFKGKNFTSWMNTVRTSSVVLQNLVKISLMNCNKCEQIPPMGRLPNLKVVHISRMSNVKCIGKEFYGGNINDADHGVGSNTHNGTEAVAVTIMFPSLRKLTLFEMPKLQDWLEAVTVHDPSSPSANKLFPDLEELYIRSFPKLKMVPSHFQSLKKLEVADIDNSVALEKISTKLNSLTSLTLNSIKGGSSEFQSTIVDKFLENNTSLRELILMSWDALSYMSNNLRNLVALETLVITYCHSLTSISASGSQSRARLKQLIIGPFSEDLDHFLWPFHISSVSILFHP